MITRSVCIAAILVSQTVSAQWLNHRDAATPRGRDGKPNLSAAAPRRQKTPDFSGIWQVESTSRQVLSSLFPPGVGLLPGGENGLGEDDPSKYFLNILADYKFGEEPLTPTAQAKLRAAMEHPSKPMTLCTPASLPVEDLLPAPFKIVQTANLMLMLYEADTAFRQVYLDGRDFPADPQPAYLGYSVGHWEGDALVIEVRGLNDQSPLDAMGHSRSPEMKLTERFERPDFGHMKATLTLEDPRTFTKPVKIAVNYRLLPDTDLIESFCTEGEKDVNHIASR